ncbi:MAG: FtsX-like permease family protein [Saprospiraceae bacterium]|nr:FtsX-like permease family protein [Saprospiraceae bacterium]
MNLSFRIARRYLFAKRSTNAINIITGISIFGLSVGTAALILVSSVFNGFDDLISGMYGNFNPDLRVTPEIGKSFSLTDKQLQVLRGLPEVAYVSQTLEEIAFFEYSDKQDFGLLKGVDEYYQLVTNIDSTIREGSFALTKGEQDMVVLGMGMRVKLAVDVNNPFNGINVYMAKKEGAGLFGEPFRRRTVQPAGSFLVQQDFDNQYVLSSIGFARKMLATRDEVSALEIKVAEGYRPIDAKRVLEQELGDGFVIKDRYEQEEAFMKLMQLEKWMGFAIGSLMLLLIAFNLVGALWMIVLEKKNDISILKSMGATNTTVRNIFLKEGLLLTAIGLGTGLGLAMLLYIAQKQLDLIGIPGSFMVSAYPISMRWGDVVIITITVLLIGLIASIPPALRAIRVPALMREE